ncbi:MAG: hypothetical protein IKZ87_01505 [Actinomycetaceae bacterium]|nr:hypothetical protein [Actinomycetaceae bacterium]
MATKHIFDRSHTHLSELIFVLHRILDHEDWESDDLETLRDLAESVYDVTSEFQYVASKMVRNVKNEQRRHKNVMGNEYPGRVATARAMLEKGLISEKDISEYCGLDVEIVKVLALAQLLGKKQPNAA